MVECLPMAEIAPRIFLRFRGNKFLVGLLGDGRSEITLEGACDQSGWSRWMMGAVDSTAALLSLLAQPGFDLGPVFPPATRAQDIADGQHGIDMFFCPVHACPFQACLYHQLVTTLHHATANRPTLCLKERVLHLDFAFFQVRQIAGDRFCSGMFSL